MSRTVSHALRHDPDAYGLALDPDGWVPLDDLVTALHGLGSAWSTVTRTDVELVVVTAAGPLSSSRAAADPSPGAPGRRSG